MKKSFLFIVSLVLTAACMAQTLQSPEQFLGYKIGTKFTPHYKIVNYFNAVAKASPTMVKLEKYGETYEGRDLLLTYIASPENLANLEKIRTNNLALTSKNNNSATTDVPAIVWLSYNVHGNETSSSEAAMLTLHSLVDP